MSVWIFVCKSIAINEHMKSHRHHKILGFFPGVVLFGFFTAAVFNSPACFWGVLLSFLPSASEMQLSWIQVDDWLGLRRAFHFFSFQRKCPGSHSKSASGHCPSAMWSAVPWVLKQMIQTYTYTLFRIHIINKYMGTSSTSSRARWDFVTNNEQILSFSYVHLFLWLWCKLRLVASVHRMLFQICTGSFSFIPDLHVVVNALCLLWWSLLKIVDFDTDTGTFTRMLFIQQIVVKGLFFTGERIPLLSSGLLVLLSSTVWSFFSL